jgi:hypothetical protein
MSSPVSPQITAQVQFTANDEWRGVLPAPDGDVRITFRVTSGNYIARFSTLDGKALVSGERVVVPVEFMSPELALPQFQVGTQFKIWAGKDVGVGEAISVGGGTSNKSLERTREG